MISDQSCNTPLSEAFGSANGQGDLQRLLSSLNPERAL